MDIVEIMRDHFKRALALGQDGKVPAARATVMELADHLATLAAPVAEPVTITMDGKYQTRDGRPVRLLCVDRKHPDWPVVGLVLMTDGTEVVSQWRPCGRFAYTSQECLDLVPMPVKPPRAWYEHQPGNPCPVAPDVRVEVRRAGGSGYCMAAGQFCWGITKDPRCNIRWWSPAEEPEAAPPVEGPWKGHAATSPPPVAPDTLVDVQFDDAVSVRAIRSGDVRWGRVTIWRRSAGPAR